MKALFVFLGLACVAVGAVGIVVPGLPTTPFLLLASALFLRSSERLHRWLVGSRLLGRYIRRYREQGGMTLRAKLVVLAIMWAMIGLSLFALDSAVARMIVAAVGVVGTVVMGGVVRTVRAGSAGQGEPRSGLDRCRAANVGSPTLPPEELEAGGKRGETAVRAGPIDAVVFDCGGVLTLPPPRREMRELAALCGLGLRAFRREWRRERAAYDRGTLEASAYWGRILAAGRGERERPPLPELIERDYASWARGNEAILRWARSLSAAGFRIAILSNMPRDLLERMRAHLSWFADFPVGVFSCEVACVKPEERMFGICLESLGVEPQRTMFIDDSLANVRAARRLGITAVHFRTVGRLLRQAGRLLGADPAARVAAPEAESAP